MKEMFQANLNDSYYWGNGNLKKLSNPKEVLKALKKALSSGGESTVLTYIASDKAEAGDIAVYKNNKVLFVSRAVFKANYDKVGTPVGVVVIPSRFREGTEYEDCVTIMSLKNMSFATNGSALIQQDSFSKEEQTLTK